MGLDGAANSALRRFFFYKEKTETIAHAPAP